VANRKLDEIGEGRRKERRGREIGEEAVVPQLFEWTARTENRGARQWELGHGVHDRKENGDGRPAKVELRLITGSIQTDGFSDR